MGSLILSLLSRYVAYSDKLFVQAEGGLLRPHSFNIIITNTVLLTFTSFNFQAKKNLPPLSRHFHHYLQYNTAYFHMNREKFSPLSRLWAISSSDLSRTAGSVCIQRRPGERVGWTSNTWWWWAWWSCSRRQSEVTYCFPQEGKEKCCAIDADVPTGLDDGLSWQWWW